MAPSSISSCLLSLPGTLTLQGDEPAHGMASSDDIIAANSDRSNDAAILLAMAKTYPAAYNEHRQRATSVGSCCFISCQ